MKRTFVALVTDKPGVLNQVASLFRRRAFNIESLTVGHTEKPGVSRMTIVIDTDPVSAERIKAYLYKLVNVLHVEELTDLPTVSRDLAMVKIQARSDTRNDVMQLVDVFRARIVDINNDSLIIEITGTEDKIDSFVDVLKPFGIIEMAQTGSVAMQRGPVALSNGQSE